MQATQVDLVKTKSHTINRVNKKREHVEFFPGDLVLVSAANWPLPQGLTPKFNHRYYGPYKIIKQINNFSYKLQLPTTSKIQNLNWTELILLSTFTLLDSWSWRKTHLASKCVGDTMDMLWSFSNFDSLWALYYVQNYINFHALNIKNWDMLN